MYKPSQIITVFHNHPSATYADKSVTIPIKAIKHVIIPRIGENIITPDGYNFKVTDIEHEFIGDITIICNYQES